MNWILKHWPILALVFASGGAAAWQEVQRQAIKDVIADQHRITKEQHAFGKTVIELHTRQESVIKQQDAIQRKLDLLIELQIKGANNVGRPR